MSFKASGREDSSAGSPAEISVYCAMSEPNDQDFFIVHESKRTFTSHTNATFYAIRLTVTIDQSEVVPKEVAAGFQTTALTL